MKIRRVPTVRCTVSTGRQKKTNDYAQMMSM